MDSFREENRETIIVTDRQKLAVRAAAEILLKTSNLAELFDEVLRYKLNYWQYIMPTTR